MNYYNPGITSIFQSSVSVNIDDDVSDLLRDNFGPANSEDFAPKIDFSDIELDKNLSEILEDLQKVVKTEDGENNNCSSSLINDPIQSLLNIRNEMEMEMEEERVERLRNPKFQTLPAYQKRAKQETQWLKALNAAKTANISESPPCLMEPISAGSLTPSFSAQQINQTTSTSTSNGGKRVEVILLTEDEADEISGSSVVSPKLKGPQSTDLSLSKSNILMNTEKHLSSSNHFPANSRIFNRSLEELQSTAKAISKSYLLDVKGKEIKKQKRRSPYPTKPRASSSAGNKRKMDNMRSILIKNNNTMNSTASREKVDIYSSVWLPALKQRLQAGKLAAQAQNLHKSGHVPVPQAPGYFSPREVKLPINMSQQKAPYLRLNMSSNTPVLLNKSQVLQAVAGRSARQRSCQQCQRLSSYLPYLGYNMRKYLTGDGHLGRNSAGDCLVLLCEVCGSFVRESVIHREQISLSSASASPGCFPKFFNNTNIQIGENEESQNYIPN